MQGLAHIDPQLALAPGRLNYLLVLHVIVRQDEPVCSPEMLSLFTIFMPAIAPLSRPVNRRERPAEGNKFFHHPVFINT